MEDCGYDNGIVLVACKDEHSCMQLQDCIEKGSHKVFHSFFYKARNLEFLCVVYFLNLSLLYDNAFLLLKFSWR